MTSRHMMSKTVMIHFPLRFNDVSDGTEGSRSSGFIATIKAIRMLTGMGLKETKDIVDARGAVRLQVIGAGVFDGRDEAALSILREAGCFAGFEDSGDDPVDQPELPSIDMLTIVIKRELDNNRFNVALRLMEVLAEHYSS